MDKTLAQSGQPAVATLVAFFEHNTWANVTLLEFCAGLSDEQLDASTIGSYGSIRDTLLHIVGAEVSYVRRVNGKLPSNPPPKDQFPGFEVLLDDARWAGDELLQLALSAQADTLVIEHRAEGTGQYKLTDLMVQALTHSVEHRTQVSATITYLNIEPPDLSGWAWMRAKGEFSLTERKAAT